jgi:TatD DNase family protein
VTLRAEPATGLSLYDAHNHLQDERLALLRETILATTQGENIRKMVVNGSSEADWPAVLELARQCPQVIPSFGYHPWYINQRSQNWDQVLIGCLEQIPSGVGEIGLDKWIKDYDLPQQERVFARQLEIAAARNLPVSIHCLQAWGTLFELLNLGRRPRCGFLLHSFGGPQEMIEPLARLGAYFSLPGYFAHERKARQRETFRHVPRDRLLIETDAPDQSLPPSRIKYPLTDEKTGKPVNHPANLGAVYQFAAELLELPVEALAGQVQENFQRLFGGVA